MTSAMADVKPPDHAKPTRRERARATRLRITRAAYARFCERGYAGTTMADVAESAGVAVQTVYFVFHTKTELLSGAYELAVLGEDDPQAPELQRWYLAAAAEPDIGAALSSVVRGIGEIIRRAAPLDTVVRAAGSHDPEAAAVWECHERLRIDGYGRIVAVFAKKAPLRPGVTLDRATDLFLFYLGPLSYVGLVMDRGWSYDDWLEWTVATLLELVFAP